jgi:hypothetical protein
MSKVIINSGNRRLIGEVTEDLDDIQPGDNVIVRKAYELRCDMFLMPSPQGMAIMNKTSVVPVDAEEEGVDILVKVDNIRWFEHMVDRGRKYENMVAEFEDVLMQNRAGRAGLAMAKNMPKPQGNGGGLII